MSEMTEEQKKWATRRAVERALRAGALDVWRNVVFQDKLINSYYHGRFINYIFTQQLAPALPKDRAALIADFGSGNGRVTRKVLSQLQPLRAHRDFAVGIDLNLKGLKAMKQKERTASALGKDSALQPKAVRGTLLDLPFAEDAFDAGLLRFALPFIPEDQQGRALEEIYRVMKPGAALVVLNDGALDEGARDQSWNTLFAECAKFEGLNNMHHRPYDSLKLLAEQAGFAVGPPTDLSETTLGYLSPEICAKAFKLSPERHQKMAAMFKDWEAKRALPFEPSPPNSLRVLWLMYSCVLKK